MFGGYIPSVYTFLGRPTNETIRGFHMTEQTVTTEEPAAQPDLPGVISELRSLELRRAKLEMEAATLKKEALAGIVEIIRKYISDNGYTQEEIVGLLATKGKRTRAKPVSEGPKTVFASKIDPSKTYSRGPLPAWLKAEMVALGLDPENKEARDTFKALHMTSCTTGNAVVPEAPPAAE